MRQKAYYAIDEIITNQYTFGDEWQTADGVEYKGLYHTYTTGEAYTRPKWNATLSKPLFKLDDAEINALSIKYKQLIKLKTNYTLPTCIIPQPTFKEKQEGQYNRFFMKKRNLSNIFEIDEPQYDKWLGNKIDNNLYIAIKIIWSIGGSVDDVRTGPYIVRGARYKNIAELRRAEKLMPGITSYIRNPIEYYSDNDYIVPKDVNE